MPLLTSGTEWLPGCPRLEMEEEYQGVYRLLKKDVPYCPPKMISQQHGQVCHLLIHTPPQHKKQTSSYPPGRLRLLHLHSNTTAWTGVNTFCYCFPCTVNTSTYYTPLKHWWFHYNRRLADRSFSKESLPTLETLKCIFTFRHTTEIVSHLRFLFVTGGSTVFWHRPNILSEGVGLPHPTHIVWPVFFSPDHFRYVHNKWNNTWLYSQVQCST